MSTLVSLARSSFEKLSQAELEVLESSTFGRLAVCASQPISSIDAREGPTWGPERQIRGEVIRWLCVERGANSLIDPNGVQIVGARIVGHVNLFAATVPFPLRLQSCSFDNNLSMQCAEIPVLNLQGSWIPSLNADGIRVKHNLMLRNGFHASGQVRLLAARIGGVLDCDGSRFENPHRLFVPQSGITLNADGAIIDGAVFLRNGFRSVGEARLVGARIDGYLDCTNGTFLNPLTDKARTAGTALNLQSARISRNVSLRGQFFADGEVTLAGAQIGGDVDCTNAKISNSENGVAFTADRATVSGSVFLGNGFRAEGEVRLLGLQIGSDLHCDSGEFSEPRIEDGVSHSISCHTSVVKGNVLLRDKFRATGEVAFTGAQIGGNLECMGADFNGELNLQTASITGELFILGIRRPNLLRLNLTNAKAGSIRDDISSWPQTTNLLLDGFTYKRFAEPSPLDAESRIVWISRQKAFAAQPYRQLAIILRNEGDDAGSRRVLFEMETERSRREIGAMRAWNLILKYVIGYGYYPRWALAWLLGLVFLGMAIFYSAFYAGGMVPTDRQAYGAFVATNSVPYDYPRFHALAYSVENSVPLLKLGQLEGWRPDQRSHVFLQWFCWWQVLLGWFFATMGIAGVAGLVRKE
jgi:hypothetical protein